MSAQVMALKIVLENSKTRARFHRVRSEEQRLDRNRNVLVDKYVLTNPHRR